MIGYSNPCSKINLVSYDVLIAHRDEFLKEPPEYVAPILGLIEDGTFQELKTLTQNAVLELSNRWAAKAEEIEAGIKHGTIQGYGLLRIENQSDVICMTPGTQEDALRSLLSDQRKVLDKSFTAAPEISIRTADTAFSAAKRGQCGAVFAGQADLSETIQALQRDRIGYSVVPLWFSVKDISDRAGDIQREKKLSTQEEEARKLQLQEATQLEELKRKKEAEEKGTRETELRKQNGPKARALADEIANGIKLIAENKNTWAADNFPGLASWYREQNAKGCGVRRFSVFD